MSSRKIKKLLKEAESAKKEAATNSQNNNSKTGTQRKNIQTPPDDERWKVYRILLEKNVELYWYIFIPLSVIPWIMWLGGSLSARLFVISITIAILFPFSRYVYIKVNSILNYSNFRYWRRHLPFHLVGWEQLVDQPNFGHSYWCLQATITVNFYQNTPNQEILDVLHIFTKKANSKFYKADFVIEGFSGDPRKRWMVNKNTISGSINAGVALVLYHFLIDDLSLLAKTFTSISNVTIETDSKAYHIPFESTDSVGGTAS